MYIHNVTNKIFWAQIITSFIVNMCKYERFICNIGLLLCQGPLLLKKQNYCFNCIHYSEQWVNNKRICWRYVHLIQDVILNLDTNSLVNRFGNIPFIWSILSTTIMLSHRNKNEFVCIQSKHYIRNEYFQWVYFVL